MASWGIQHFDSAQVFGTHDVGLTSWTIRWKSAGWAMRDNMSVWSHCGIITKYNSTLFIAEMLLNYSYRYFGYGWGQDYINNPSDNPGITSMFTPWLFMPQTAANPLYAQAGNYLMASISSLGQSRPRYDAGTLLSAFFGIPRGIQKDDEYICNELVWVLIAGTERVFGLRCSSGFNKRYLEWNSQKYRDVYGYSDYYPTTFFNSDPLRLQFSYPGARCAWNTGDIINVWSPYLLERNRSATSIRYPGAAYKV